MDKKLMAGRQILEMAMNSADLACAWLMNNAEFLAEQGIEWIQTEGAEGNLQLARDALNFAAEMAGLLAEFPLQAGMSRKPILMIVPREIGDA